MYESFFGLARRPFAATPDPGRFVPVETARESLEKLVQCAEIGQGIGILTAPAGMGKSLLCAKLIGQLAESFMPVFLASANFPTRRSLLQAILYELGHPYIRMAEQELRLELTTAAKKARDESGGVLLVVDEAHLLSTLLLEEIRTITNLVEAGEPLTRVILSGQLLLEEKLAVGGLDALNQRIACQVSLEPLTRQESIEYLSARIRSAGGDVSEIFSSEAIETIARASDGVPRCLNQLCDHSLLLGYASDVRPVGLETVRDALEDLKQLPLHWNEPSPARTPTDPDAHRAARSPSFVGSRQNAGWSGGRSDDLAGSQPEKVDGPADQAPTAFESIEIGHEPTSASGEPVDAGPGMNSPQSADDSYANESFTDATRDTPSAVFEVGSGTAPSSDIADENNAAGCAPGQTVESVDPGSMTEPSDEPLPAGSIKTEESLAGGVDELSLKRPDTKHAGTYRLVEPVESGSGNAETEAFDFEEEIIEDRYAQLDAGLIPNDNPRRSTPPQPPAPVTASTDESPQRDGDSLAGWAAWEPRKATPPTSTSISSTARDLAVVSSWIAAGDADPVQIIDGVAPLLDEELQTRTGDFNTFDSLVMPAEIEPAECRIVSAECRIVSPECRVVSPECRVVSPEYRLEQPTFQRPEDWLTANDAIVSLPIGIAGTELVTTAAGLSGDAAEDSPSDLDMPSQLIGFTAERTERLQISQDDAVPQLGVVILDDWLESSSVESPATGPSSAVSLPPSEFPEGTAARIAQHSLPSRDDAPAVMLSDTQESRNVQEFAATQEFDVVQPEPELSANTSDAPGESGRIPAGSQQSAADSPPAAPHSSRPHGRYDQLFSDLRRRASRPA